MVTPIRDNVVVRPEPHPAKTRSGLIIPWQRRDAKNNNELVKATVVAVGAGYYNTKGVFISPYLKVGDTVLYGGRDFTGIPFEEDGVEYRIMESCEILAVLK